MSNKPKVSVIIPIYNVEKYLAECIESVLNQELTDIELVCINDGSTDKSLDILKTYQSKYSNIIVKSQKNRGLSAARNTGLSIAKGQYIAFLDSDDRLARNSLIGLLKIAEQEQLDVLFFDALSFYEDQSLEQRYPQYKTTYTYLRKKSYDQVTSGLELMCSFVQDNTYRPSVLLYLLNANWLKETGFRFQEGIIHEDHLFTFQIFFHARKVTHRNTLGYERRVRNGSIMTTPSSHKNVYGYLITLHNLINLTKESIVEKAHEECISRYLKSIAQSIFNLFNQLPATEQHKLRQQLTDEESQLLKHLLKNNSTSNSFLTGTIHSTLKLSVIIPVHNAEDCIDKCLKSVLSQSINSFEVICIDDGSTDQSAVVIKSRMQKDNRIRLYKQENKGAGSAKNAGIKRARGEFIAFMDADDAYPDDEVLLDLYCGAKESCSFISGGSLSCIHDGESFSRCEPEYAFYHDGVIRFKDYQFDGGYHRFIYSRALLLDNDIYFPNYWSYQGSLFFVRAMVQSQSFYAMERLSYCCHTSSRTMQSDKKNIISVVNDFADVLEISSAEKLEKLHLMTLDRLEIRYKNIVQNYIKNHQNQDLLNALTRAEKAVNVALLPPERINYALGYSNLSNSLCKMLNESKVRDEYNKKIKALKSSRSYKIGTIITYVPRKTRSTIRCFCKNGLRYTLGRLQDKLKNRLPF